MSKARIMGAGNAGASSVIRLNGNVGGGNIKQGLVPMTNKPSRLFNILHRGNPMTNNPSMLFNIQRDNSQNVSLSTTGFVGGSNKTSS
jgi:hypothetical protein